MFMDLDVGPDDSDGEVLSVEFARPDGDGPFATLRIPQRKGAGWPSRESVIGALFDVLDGAAYALQMLTTGSEGLAD